MFFQGLVGFDFVRKLSLNFENVLISTNVNETQNKQCELKTIEVILGEYNKIKKIVDKEKEIDLSQ